MAEASRAESTRRACDRIDAWLRRHAARLHALLNPPATTEALLAVEEALQAHLPADLRAWWEYADGVVESSLFKGGDLIPPRFSPYSTRFALSSRRTWMQVGRDVAPVPPAELERYISDQGVMPAGTPADTWLPPWLPLATATGADDLFVDLRPGPHHACVMDFGADTGTHPGPVWSSVADMATEIATALDSGAAVHGRAPRISETGLLLWR